ncbi:MAG TPA: hypothetical protein VGC36_12315 [Rhizomicrobium sp.]
MLPRITAIIAAALCAGVAYAAITPGPTVTDANVIARLGGPLLPADHLALAAYYRAEAKAEEARIEFTDRLFRAYMQLEGKRFEPAKEQARKLLRAARESRKRDDLLAAAHQTLAFEQADQGAVIDLQTPSPGTRQAPHPTAHPQTPAP